MKTNYGQISAGDKTKTLNQLATTVGRHPDNSYVIEVRGCNFPAPKHIEVPRDHRVRRRKPSLRHRQVVSERHLPQRGAPPAAEAVRLADRRQDKVRIRLARIQVHQLRAARRGTQRPGQDHGERSPHPVRGGEQALRHQAAAENGKRPLQER